MKREIIPSNTKAGRALKVITVIVVLVGLAIDVLPVVLPRTSAMFPVLAMFFMPIGIGVTVSSLVVEVPIIIYSLIKKRNC